MNREERGSLRCALYCIGPDGHSETSLIGPEDEVVLVLRPSAPASVTVELWRGERLRDRWNGTIVRSTFLRLRHGDGAGASSRLTCRVLVAGREGFCRTLLQARP